ncbi:tRNA (adenosine(37)-N6)-threonylcarbamoyltransferase complex dimerization subunit type 1 TsaB [Alicyclobacillus mali (ex Roth et al. 2021)]|uniref:tRNA (adenosine(37)-N6)-threonylcarbamoyltransferase complex dimerization subunit type 1 TsaB n=1 Tax=Alicyclobacillus mali (ex Roth et al. 2021) TaxID=1123961 RepID=UPI001A8FD43F|nr:tRNA (adenosine(37)-N6)-threonylcarbamoyltransferase complex dimerization subunit type 1 TsaB [Alicyclobacillus mali (ex Roth et al. 2021)]
MSVIAMDTATDVLALAVADEDGRLMSSLVEFLPRAHSRLLQPSLGHLLAGARMNIHDVKLCVTGVGPGSYTGVRIAVAAAKAIGHACGIPIVSVPTVDGMAMALACAEGQRFGAFMALIDARRDRAFGCWYRLEDGRLWAQCEPTVQSLADWFAIADRERASIVASGRRLGDSAEAQGVRVRSWNEIAPMMPTALVRLGLSGSYERFEGERVHDLAPLYVLPTEAEAKLGAKGEGGE